MPYPARAPTRILTGVALVVAAVLFAGCSANGDDADDLSDGGTGPDAAPSVFEHIHALSPGENSGELLVATHEGLYEVVVASDGTGTANGPVGGLDFDPMGFTVSGDTAYASGHPGPTTPDSFGSPNLGLIVSTDRGQSWDNVSLTGQTDFHALTVSPPVKDGSAARIFGIDSSKSTIQRSLDGGTTWTDGAELVARDILVDPTDPGTIYATTEKGLAQSSDDAASFAILSQAPALYLLGADNVTGALAGIDTTGAVWTEDDTDTWVRGGTVSGTPQAVAVSGERLYVADDRGIAFTDDDGTTWTVVDLSR